MLSWMRALHFVDANVHLTESLSINSSQCTTAQHTTRCAMFPSGSFFLKSLRKCLEKQAG